MGYRTFTDAIGTEWQAWDIIPRLAERRVGQRRNTRVEVQSDRRQLPERRITLGERSVLTQGLHRGWLCFEAALEKRRLAPVPPDWLRCTVARLEEYLAAALPVPRMTGNVPDIGALDRRAG